MPEPSFTVSLVGRPNVGKSTLFNRLAGKRRAITYNEPGVTRDLVAQNVSVDGKRVRLVDTGGYLSQTKEDLLVKVRGQVLRAIYESDLVLFLVDARDGVLPLDKEIASMLREREKRFFLVPNKVDSRAGQEGVPEFHEISASRMFPISAEHGTGVGELASAVAELVPAQAAGEEREPIVPRVAVLGRPNVGKSTLVNALAGYDRVIASEIPGTTRDSIDVLVNYRGKRYLLIDTAGIRPRAKTETVLEKFSVLKSLESLRRCDLAILLIDGPAGITHQDQQILRYILSEERAVVVAANKADRWEGEEGSREKIRRIRESLGYAAFAPVVPLSALSGKGIPALFRKVEEGFESFQTRVSTGLLNREAATFLYPVPIPSTRGRNRAFYITQVGVMPPSFAVFVKDRAGVPESYTRFVQNRLRDRFGFRGAPIRILYREK